MDKDNVYKKAMAICNQYHLLPSNGELSAVMTALKTVPNWITASARTAGFYRAGRAVVKPRKEIILDTANVYQDSEGNDRTIWQMIKHEPEWAANRIQAGEKAIEQLRWIPVAEQMPEPGRFVLAFYKNGNGMDRRIRAMYAAPKTLELSPDAEGGEYDEETDTYWCDPGWYEENEHEECHWAVDEEITHWMPLPAPPSAESV